MMGYNEIKVSLHVYIYKKIHKQVHMSYDFSNNYEKNPLTIVGRWFMKSMIVYVIHKN